MQVGDVIGGRFLIERLAASGGMGRIFQAVDRASGEPVAIKVLLGGGDPEIARFTREAELLQGLSHPHIVRALGHGVTEGGEPYLALEWLEGEDLEARLARGPLEVAEALTLAALTAEALGAAHALGVVHRDVKPSNIFLVGGAVDRLKVLDFGVARLGGAAARLTRTGAIIGTLGYMAPEQARGGARIDARADVFALGAVLFECLTGAAPFAGDDLAPVLAKILFNEVPRASTLRPEVSEALDELVADMLSKDPERRPPDGEALARSLSAAAAGLPRTDAPRALRPAALTGVERRTVSIVLVGAGAVSADSETVRLDAVHESPEAVRREAEAFGAELMTLADGSIIAALSGPTAATDQAARAARLSLTLRQASGRPAALVTGRREGAHGMEMGDVIDRASRMLAAHASSAARAGAPPPVLIDEMTANLLDARFDVRETAAGLALHGERRLTSGARTLLGKITPCVGRERELAWLEGLFAACVDEETAQAAVVTAPAGAGKSRLAQELIRRVRHRFPGAAVLIGRGDSLQSGSPFAMLVQILRGALGLRSGEPLEAQRQALAAGVASIVGAADAARVTELLGELVGVPAPEASPLLEAARRDARVMSEHLQRAWEELLSGVCAARPVLLVLEDLHWGDGATVRFVDGALGRLRGRPWMVLALGRPELSEAFPRLWDSRGAHRINLRELSPRACERLIRHMLGDGVDADTLERLTARSAGNAFYLEELIRATAERGAEALPETVVSMVEVRLSHVHAEARRILRAASVFGEVFWAGGVAALTGVSGAPLEARLAELCEREILVRRPEPRFPGEVELAFHHALLREGAYAMLTDGDLALGHRLAADWLEARGETDALILAQHFELGREPARAARLYLSSAQRCMLGADTDAAIAHAERGRACGGPPEVDIGLTGVLCEAHAWKRAWHEALPHAREVMRRTPPASTPWLQAAFLRLAAANSRADRAEMAALADTLRDIRPAPESRRMLSVLLGYLAVHVDGEGSTERVDEMMARMRALAGASGASELTFIDALQSFREARVNEDPWSGYQLARSANAAFEAMAERRSAEIARVMMGMNLWFLGALEEAERELRAADTAGALGPTAMVAPFCLAWTLADRGALEEAGRIAADLTARGVELGHELDEGRGRWALAEILRRRGDLAAAEREARRAVELLAFRPIDQTGTQATLSLTMLAQGRAAEALAAAEAALAAHWSANACGFFRAAWLRLARAEALWATGDRGGARDAIAEAHAKMLQIAGKIGPEEHRRSYLERVPENARTSALHREWIEEAAGR